jgi:hypothetical protein
MKIRIKHCDAVGPKFENMKYGSEHLVIDTAYHNFSGVRQEKRMLAYGYWVKGVGENVVVLFSECEIVEDGNG